MAHETTIQLYRGAFSGLPVLADGEPGWCTDTYQLFIGDGATNHEVGSGIYQPLDATLTALAGLTIAANSLIIGTGADAFSVTAFAANTFPARASTGDLVAKSITDFALTILDDANGAAVLTTIGGQPLDATLTAFAALTIAANSLTIGTGADAFSQTAFAANTFPARASTGNLEAKTITDFGLSLVDDADAAAGRTTLGGTTVGQAVFASTNPSAITFLRANADNTVSWLSASAFTTAIGAAVTSGTLAQFAATTSAELRGIISDETGTGALVFANSANMAGLDVDVLSVNTINGVTILDATAAFIDMADSVTLTVPATASVSGTNTGDQTSVTGNAGTVTVADAGSDTTTWVLLGTSQTGSLAPATDAGLTYNASTDALSLNSANATGTTTSAALSVAGNSLTTGTGIYAASSTLTSGLLVNLQVSGTAAAASQTALNILTAGATATNGITTYGAQISNTHTNATSGTNVALSLNASGATTGNYALVIPSTGGNAGFGTTTPGSKVDAVQTQTDPAAAVSAISAVTTTTLTADNALFTSGVVGDSRVNQGGFNYTNSAGIRGISGVGRTTGSSGTVTVCTAVLGTVINSGAGTLTNAYSFFLNAPTNTGGGTLTNAYGIFIPAITAGTNNYAIRAQVASAANRWNLYCDGTADNYLAGDLGIGTNDPTAKLDVLGDVYIGTASNGTRLKIQSLTELTTIAAAAFTDTTIQIPAGAQVLAVTCRVTTAIPTATTFDVGVSGATARYATGVSVAVNTTDKGTLDGHRYYAAATSIRITPSATPGANTGRLRVTIFYMDVTPSTS